jgi:hypothetical protein
VAAARLSAMNRLRVARTTIGFLAALWIELAIPRRP